MIELPLLRVRSFALANLATLVFFMGFGAMLLSGVLLLTEVWGWSELRAGFALSPGPLMAALFAVPSGRLGAKIGQRPVATAGGLVFAAGFAFMLASVGATPEYATTFLPAFMLGGAGVGMALGTLPAAATAALPPGRFATGSAVFGMARQLGSAIGVAVLVALIDSASGDLLHGIAQRLVVRPRRRPRRGGPGVLAAGAGENARSRRLPGRGLSQLAAYAASSSARPRRHSPVDVGLGQFGCAAPAAHLVLRLEHLVDVVDLVLDLDLGRAGREPVDQFGVVARVEVTDDGKHADDEQQDRDRPQQKQHRSSIRPRGPRQVASPP